MKFIRVLVCSLLCCSLQLSAVADESATFSDFQQLAIQSDAKAAIDSFKRSHPSPATTTKMEVESFTKARIEMAMSLLDKAKTFESQYPQSTHLSAVRSLAMENLWVVFGDMALPIPSARVADVESWTRKGLGDNPQDYRLYIILVEASKALPPTQQEAALQELSQEKTPEPARSMAKDALEKFKLIGHPLNLKFTALDGGTVDLAALKGKVVLVDFWSTTCVPCIRDMPDLKKLYSKYKPQGLEIIGITLDENKDALQRFIQKEEMSWPQYYDPKGTQNPLAQKFAINSIPVVWLVDRRGILRDLNGREGRERKIEELLAEP